MSPQPVSPRRRLAARRARSRRLATTAPARSSGRRTVARGPRSPPLAASRPGDAQQPGDAPLRGRDQGRRGAGQVRASATTPRSSVGSRRCSQADPTFAEADYNLGVLAERQGKRDQAYALYLSALQKKPSLQGRRPRASPGSPGPRAIRPSAIAQWNDIARAFPDDAESRAQLAELYRLTGDHDRAQELARQALIRDPKSLDAYKTLLRSNLDRKQFAMAELVGVRALKISSTDPDLYLALGDVQLAKGAADKAAAQYQKALEASPGFVPARLALAQLALRDEDFAAAEKQLSRAVADGGGSAEVHLDLGVAYRGLGQPDKALVEYDAAEKLQPRLAAIYLNRGIVLQRYKDAPEKSLELYKQYVALSGGESALPNDAPVLALRREAEQLVAAKSQARAQEQQSKTLEQAQQLQQQRLKDAEERAAKGTPAKATAPDTGKQRPEKL